MKKTVIAVMILTIISKLIGFSRELVLSNYYGASYISDSYLISLTIPGTIFAFFGIAVSTNYIPMYRKIFTIKDRETADLFSSKLINLLVIITIIISILVIIYTEPIVKVFASGFEGDSLSLAIRLTRISVFSIIFSGITYIFNGYLNIHESYLAPIIAGIPFNLVTIVSIIISSKGNVVLLAYGSIMATASQLIIVLIYSKLKGFNYQFNLNFINSEWLKKMAFLSVPVMLGTSVNQLNRLVDRTLASRITEGGISALNYSDRLNHFIFGIFVTSIATVIYPQISKMAFESNFVGFKKLLKSTYSALNIFLIPSTVGIMIFSIEITEFLFARGAFDNNATVLTSSALYFYSVGMLAMGLREILSRAFYSLQNTKTPMVNATFGMILNIILNIILSSFLGIGGLALATSISAMFTTLLLFISLRKKIGPFGMKQISISFLKILFASLVMGGLAKLSFNFLTSSLSQNLSLLIAIGVGAASYFVIIYFMKIEDVDVIVGAIKKKFGRGAA